MPWFVSWFVVTGVLAVLGIVGAVLALRKTEWPRLARALILILGLSVALPALWEILVLLYLVQCEPTMNCL